MITVKEFDTLSKRDFENGAVQDEIRKTLKCVEQIKEAFLKLKNAKRRGCSCDSFGLQYNGRCTCGRGDAIKKWDSELKKRVELLT